MVTFRYINKNAQQGFVSYTLLIEDEGKEQFVETVRIEKTFKMDIRLIDDEFLRAEARKEIDSILYQLENPSVVPPLDEVPNGDLSE